jgi:tetratricopeptide (TPR) repeat protein
MTLSVLMICAPVQAQQDDYVRKPLPLEVVRAFEATMKRAIDLRERGKEYFAARQYEKAIPLLQESVRLDGSDDTHALLGDAFAALGRMTEADESYKKAIGLIRNHNESHSRWSDGDLHLRYALLLLQAGRYTEAIPMYEKGLSLLGGRSASLFREERFFAIQFTSKSSVRFRMEAAIHCALAIKRMGHGDVETAQAYLEEAARRKSDFAATYLLLGDLSRRQGKPAADVRALYQKAIDLGHGPVKQEALQRRGGLANPAVIIPSRLVPPPRPATVGPSIKHP